MLNCIAVGIGGFVGSVLRYLVGIIPVKNGILFPINTLVVNIAGAFLIGILAAMMANNIVVDGKPMLFLKVGLCGGFTTFSTFSLETLELFKTGHYLIALSYIVVSVALSLLAVYLGDRLVGSY